MEVKPGYKQTEVGVIPEEWDAKLLEKVAKRGSGHTPDKKHPEYWNGDIKWISLADSDALDDLFITDTFAKITPLGIANSSAVVHPPGTVVLSRDAGIGKSAIMSTAMAVSQHFMAWCCGPQLHNKFLYYWLQSAKPEFERIGNGSTIKTIGLPYFRDLKIPFPPPPEQRAIADALSDVDALLGGLDRLIAKKRDLKQGAMQQLLTRQTRLPDFHGEWRPKKFAELLKYERPDRFLVRSADYEEKGDTPILTANKSFVLGYTNEVFGVYSTLPVIIFDDFTTDSKYVDFPFKVKSSAIKILRARSTEVNLKFVFERMRLVKFPLGEHKRYYISEYQNIELPTPEPDEQTAIARVLTDMDAELVALEQRREKTRALKEAMMQELLTGRTRLV